MKLAIMQPYFLPYIGYWQLIKAVDKYVVYDDVTYIKGGWINRNNILISGQKKLFTITLNGAGSYKLINEIEIGDDFSRFLKTIQANYAKAPFFREIMALVKTIVANDSRCLSKFITNSIQKVLDYLNIDTEILVSSEISKDCTLKGKNKVIQICKNLGADSYYNAIGGQELYDKAEFASHRIELKFIKTNLNPYPQFKNEFVPGLSILDVLMFNSPEEVNRMLNNFELL